MDPPYIRVDFEADTAYMKLTRMPIYRTTEVAKGILVDIDSDGRAIGIEFLNDEAMDLFKSLADQTLA